MKNLKTLTLAELHAERERIEGSKDQSPANDKRLAAIRELIKELVR